MFAKVLVANRGEIAVRAFRAAYELGAQTVAVYPYEDRNAVHRIKADEAYLIGERGHPVRAYLDIDEIIRAARESGADAIYPGYGFLSENPDLARACDAAGITFIGPPADVLQLAGNKVRALQAAQAAGAGACDGSTSRPSCASSCRRRCARRRARSGTRRRLSSRRSAGPGTSRSRSWPTPGAPRCTCTSATAPSSVGTRRSSRSPRPPTSATSCATRCAATR